MKRTESPVPTDTSEESHSGLIRRRRVKFTDPPVSEEVEIPRSQLTGGPGSGGASITGPNKSASTSFSPCNAYTNRITQRQESSKAISVPGHVKNESEENGGSTNISSTISDTVDSYESPKLDAGTLTEGLDTTLIEKSFNEPITSILSHLTNKTFYKAAKKNLEENGIETIADLFKLSATQINCLKGLKPPNNFTTIKEGLKKFEKVLQKREIINNANNELYNKPTIENTPLQPKEALEETNASKLTMAPFMESTTPDEEDKALKEIYERPSPSPTEEEQNMLTDEVIEETSTDEILQIICEREISDVKSYHEEDFTMKFDASKENTITALNQESTTNQPGPVAGSAKVQKSASLEINEGLCNDANAVLSAVEPEHESSSQLSKIITVATQTTHSCINLENDEAKTNVIHELANKSTSEVQAVVDMVARSCQAVVNTSEIEIQTNELTQEIKIENTYKFLETLDAKTLATIMGKCHVILQAKLS